jgi:hypothetical protein
MEISRNSRRRHNIRRQIWISSFGAGGNISVGVGVIEDLNIGRSGGGHNDKI